MKFEDVVELDKKLIKESSADAKQKLYNKEIISQLRKKGWEPVDVGNDTNYSDGKYNYVVLFPIGKKYVKGSRQEAVDINLKTGKCKLAVWNSLDDFSPKEFKFDLPEDVKILCKKLRHSMQSNFRSIGKTSWGEPINRTQEMLKNTGEKGANNPKLKKILDDLDKQRINSSKEYKEAEKRGASKEELEGYTRKFANIINKKTRLGGLNKNDNIYRKMMERGLENDAKIDKRIALANAGKLSEGVLNKSSNDIIEKVNSLREEIQTTKGKKCLLMLDIDDCLLKADPTVIGIWKNKPGEAPKRLSTEEFAKDPDAGTHKEWFDYKEFRDPNKVYKSIVNGTPILKNLKLMDAHVRANWDVCFVTARGLKDVVANALKDFLKYRDNSGKLVPIGDKLKVELSAAVNDDSFVKIYPNLGDPQKKAVVIKNLCSKYDVAKFVDDDKKNVQFVKSLRIPNLQVIVAQE